MKNPGRVPYVIVYVHDLEASERFYSERLGLPVREFPVASSLGEHARALSVQGTTLVLVQRDGGAKYFRDEQLQREGGPEAGRCYPSFQVHDLTHFHHHASAAGVVCVQPPAEDEFGHLAIYKDPDGLLFSAVQLKPAKDKHGIVLSGGGAYGAFELGVLRALTADKTFCPEVVTGTSVGAFNAAAIACGLQPGRDFGGVVESLTADWLNHVAGGVSDNGVFRLRPDFLRPSLTNAVMDAAYLTKDMFQRMAYLVSPPPSPSRLLEMLDISSFFSVEPLKKLLEARLNFDALKTSTAQLQVITTDWTDGRPTVFSHSRKPTKHEERITGENFRQAVLASTAIPGLFPAVKVKTHGPHGEPDERPYVDGGLVMNSPLNPSIDAGSTVIHLICLNPEVRTLNFSPINSTLDVLERSLVTSVAGNIANDLDRVKLVNSIAGIVRRRRSDEFYRAVTVHRYHPDKEVLGGLSGILDFSKGHLGMLIENGEKLAANHQCDEAGCILPGQW